MEFAKYSRKRAVRALATASAAALIFSSTPSPAVTAQWSTAASGNWTDPTRWSTNPNYPNNNSPPGVTYDAVFDATRASSYDASFTGNIVVDSLLINASAANVLQNASGSTFQALNGLNINSGSYRMQRGTVRNTVITTGSTGTTAFRCEGLAPCTLDNVTFAGAIGGGGSAVGNATFTNGLTLNGAGLRFNPAAFNLTTTETSTIRGNGVLQMDDFDGSNYSMTVGGDQVTIAPGITVRTGTGSSSSNNNVAHLLFRDNQGIVSAENATLHFQLTGASSTNDGTFQARNGASLTIPTPSHLTNLAGTTLSGGTYAAYAGSTINFGFPPAPPPPININAASVTLSGAGSVFAPIDFLTNNSGSFELLAARDFNTTSSLSNTGRLHVDVGSDLNVVGDLTIASQAAMLQVTLGGTGIEDYGQIAVVQHAQLAGILQIDLADGYTPAPGDTFEILTAGSIDGTFDQIITPTSTIVATEDKVNDSAAATAALGTDSDWSVTYSPTGVTVTFVPEPATATIIPLISLIVLSRRERKRLHP